MAANDDNSRPDRRAAMRAALGLFALVAAPARAGEQPLAADDGSPIRSVPAPDRHRLFALPGLLTVGAMDAAVTIVEFFDYNCGYCRQASPGLDQMMKSDRNLRLVFAHNPILSPSSLRAAEAIAAVQTVHGASAAYAIHRSLLETAGRASEEGALAAARAAGLDVARIETAMTAAGVRDAVRAQRDFARENRLRFTPTFAVADRAFIGWPGAPTMTRFVAAARRCGVLQCAAERAGGG